jgi:predicted TPR repeat methyltransferase
MAWAVWVGSAPAQAQEPGPGEAALHFRTGARASQAGQADRAVTEYEKVLQLDPTLTEARVNLSYEAIAEFERPPQANPSSFRRTSSGHSII